MIASAPRDPHAHARLAEVQDLLFVAHSADDVAKATLKLVAILQDEWSTRALREPADVELLRALVREAFDLLQNPETTISLRDWIRAAEPFVGS